MGADSKAFQFVADDEALTNSVDMIEALVNSSDYDNDDKGRRHQISDLLSLRQLRRLEARAYVAVPHVGCRHDECMQMRSSLQRLGETIIAIEDLGHDATALWGPYDELAEPFGDKLDGCLEEAEQRDAAEIEEFINAA